MNRQAYKNLYSIEKSPLITFCPTCDQNTLSNKEAFEPLETKISRINQLSGDYWREDMTFSFAGLLTCTKCAATVHVVGSCTYEETIKYDEKGDYADSELYFSPLYFFPFLTLFPVPDETPEKIEWAIKSSFKVFFADPSSAANHIRCAIEELLNELKIKRYGVSKTNKRVILPLHLRIDHLPAKLSEHKEALLALKWLGNAGSHPTSITKDDVLDGYEILEHLLEQLYGKGSRIKSIIKTINQRKGPRSRIRLKRRRQVKKA